MTSWRESWRGALAAAALGWRAARRPYAALLLLTTVSGFLPVALAWVAKLLLDELAKGESGRLGVGLMLAMSSVGIGWVGLVLAEGESMVASIVRRSMTLAVEEQLYARVTSFAGLQTIEDPEFQNRLHIADEAAQRAPQEVSDFIVQLTQSLVRGGGYFGALLVVWPPMALILMIAAVPAFLAQVRLARRGTAVIEATAVHHRRRFFYRTLLTNPGPAKEVLLLGLGIPFRRRMAESLGATTEAELSVERRGAITQGLLGMVSAAASGVGAAVAVHAAIQGRLTVGDVSLFLAAVGGIQTAFTAIAYRLGRTTQALRLFRHFRELAAMPDDLPNGPRSPRPLINGIELRDVWFRYDALGAWALEGVDLVIPCGAMIGLVGRNGAGKSTLVKLVCRLYDPEQGAILWDGVDIREYDIGELRRRIGVGFQDFTAYDLTALENIGLGDLSHLTEEERIHEAARLAGADEFIKKLPRGYETLLSRVFLDDAEAGRGVSLSGGQWQRIALARTLMRVDSDLLVLDEPASGLDAVAQHRLERSLIERRRGRTTLLVSHRLGTLRKAHMIAVMSEGRVAEVGTHDALMRSEGLYAELFHIQSAEYGHRAVTQVGARG